MMKMCTMLQDLCLDIQWKIHGCNKKVKKNGELIEARFLVEQNFDQHYKG